MVEGHVSPIRLGTSLGRPVSPPSDMGPLQGGAVSPPSDLGSPQGGLCLPHQTKAYDGRGSVSPHQSGTPLKVESELLHLITFQSKNNTSVHSVSGP